MRLVINTLMARWCVLILSQVSRYPSLCRAMSSFFCFKYVRACANRRSQPNITTMLVERVIYSRAHIQRQTKITGGQNRRHRKVDVQLEQIVMIALQHVPVLVVGVPLPLPGERLRTRRRRLGLRLGLLRLLHLAEKY